MARRPRIATLKPRLAMAQLLTAPPAPKRADPELLTPQHRAWRIAVLDRAGWRCEWVENGTRCPRSRDNGDTMIADHIIERADGGALYSISNGRCLCVPHNTRKGLDARAARMGMGV